MHEIIFPPRPKSKIPPSRLASYENGKWVIQRKFNGTRVVICIEEGGDCYMLNRHGIPGDFKLTKTLKDEILSLRIERGLKYWLDGELLNAKTKTLDYKEKVILFDVLQVGRYLFGGPTLLDRLKILDSICGFPKQHEPNLGIALQATDNIWMAETFDRDFVARYNDFIDQPEIEGVVLKKKNSTLDDFGRKEYEVDWQIRCRKIHKNYTF